MKDKTKKILNSAFLIVFIGSMVIGFSFPGFFNADSGASQKYGKFNFVRKGIQWSTYVNSKELLTSYYPAEVNTIYIEPQILQMISGKYEIDSTADINSTAIKTIYQAQYDMASMMNFHFGAFMRAGVTTNNTQNIEVITCNQSTEFIPVIYFRESNETRAFKDGSCIIAEAESAQDFARIKDRILYGLLGIIG